MPQAFLKYPGGKGDLLSNYEPYIPEDFTCYYEPCVGGGAMFFHLQPEVAYLSDINPELVNAYVHVRDCVEDLIEVLAVHKALHCEEHYYRVRSQHPRKNDGQLQLIELAELSNLEQAARFIYLNKTCFNGLVRTNKRDLRFNVPMGSYSDPPICQPDILREASAALQGVSIQVKPVWEALSAPQPGDFCFIDPPYVPISASSSFTAYYGDFTLQDQVRLCHAFRALVERGVYALLCNSETPFIRGLYKDFEIVQFLAPRSINSNGEGRGHVPEVFVVGRPHSH